MISCRSHWHGRELGVCRTPSANHPAQSIKNTNIFANTDFTSPTSSPTLQNLPCVSWHSFTKYAKGGRLRPDAEVPGARPKTPSPARAYLCAMSGFDRFALRTVRAAVATPAIKIGSVAYPHPPFEICSQCERTSDQRTGLRSCRVMAPPSYAPSAVSGPQQCVPSPRASWPRI